MEGDKGDKSQVCQCWKECLNIAVRSMRNRIISPAFLEASDNRLGLLPSNLYYVWWDQDLCQGGMEYIKKLCNEDVCHNSGVNEKAAGDGGVAVWVRHWNVKRINENDNEECRRRGWEGILGISQVKYISGGWESSTFGRWIVLGVSAGTRKNLGVKWPRGCRVQKYKIVWSWLKENLLLHISCCD